MITLHWPDSQFDALALGRCRIPESTVAGLGIAHGPQRASNRPRSKVGSWIRIVGQWNIRLCDLDNRKQLPSYWTPDLLDIFCSRPFHRRIPRREKIERNWFDWIGIEKAISEQLKETDLDCMTYHVVTTMSPDSIASRTFTSSTSRLQG